MCEWCTDRRTSGDINYAGWVLLLPDREANTYVVHPHNGGLGGRGLRVPAELVPVELLVDDPARDGLSAFVAEAIVEADHESNAVSRILVMEPRLLATPAAKIAVSRAGWNVRWGGERFTIEFIVDSTTERDRLAHATLWIWADPSGQGPAWQFADARTSLANDAVKRRREARERLAGQAHGFINPYHFVPLGDGPRRTSPSGHLGLDEGRLSGKLDVTFSAVGLLAISGEGAGNEDDPHRAIWTDAGWVLPGSSISGAIRSFHEALTNSCLRIVDELFTPAYRDPPSSPLPGEWSMGVIQATAEGLRVLLCEQMGRGGQSYPAVWVEARHLVGIGQLSSADLFHFDVDGADLTVARGRLEREGGKVPGRCAGGPDCAEQHWRTIVTEAVGDRVARPQGDQHPYHLPFARVSEPQRSVDIPVPVLDAYRTAADGSHDVVKARAGARPKTLSVSGIGYRQQVHSAPTDQQVLWVKHAGGVPVRLSASVLWRSPGEHAVSERIGTYAPCSDEASLCPSCALFGMVEERLPTQDHGEVEQARVSAYRGHVRFGHATIKGEPQPTAAHLTEMGTPRPGAGQFYLNNTGWVGRQANNKRERPLREWGSAADRPPRSIRGRKRYWHSSSHPRHLARDDPNAQMTSHQKVFGKGTKLHATVWFDNVTSAQLGSLLVSLDPNLLRSDIVVQRMSERLELASIVALEQNLGHHLGKGKGVGLGSVLPSVASLDDQAGEGPIICTWSRSRYTDALNEERPSQRAVDHILRFVDDAAVESWAPLLTMTAIDWVPGSLVRYPPDDDAAAAIFKAKFWNKSSGSSGYVEGYPPVLVDWPDPDAPDPRVPRPWRNGGY